MDFEQHEFGLYAIQSIKIDETLASVQISKFQSRTNIGTIAQTIENESKKSHIIWMYNP